jgi:hypothetical protein
MTKLLRSICLTTDLITFGFVVMAIFIEPSYDGWFAAAILGLTASVCFGFSLQCSERLDRLEHLVRPQDYDWEAIKEQYRKRRT